MLIKINKAKFDLPSGCPIRCIYYLWIEVESKSSKVIFIGSVYENFVRYISELKSKCSENTGKNNKNKKSGFFNQIIFTGSSSFEIESEIKNYLTGKEKLIKVEPCFLTGTEFEKKVWTAAGTIPYGETASYKELANLAGKPFAWRAAGSAMRKNPVMLVVPCHRIIKSDKTPGKFSSGGSKVKKNLLDLEKG